MAGHVHLVRVSIIVDPQFSPVKRLTVAYEKFSAYIRNETLKFGYEIICLAIKTAKFVPYISRLSQITGQHVTKMSHRL